MLVMLSPAKTQDFSAASLPFKSPPLFFKQTAELIRTLKAYSPQSLESLLGVSPKLGTLNFERYLQFDPDEYTEATSKACIFAYQGDVYQSLQAHTLSPKALDFAQAHLLILSGLYGALRPLDAIQPYRLEMSTKLIMPNAKNLYLFWQERLLSYFNQRLESEKILINLASQEYTSVFDAKALKGRVIHITFKDWNQGQFKVLGLLAKKARGLMARFIFENQLTVPEALRHFASAGYQFQEGLSQENHYIFHNRGR